MSPRCCVSTTSATICRLHRSTLDRVLSTHTLPSPNKDEDTNNNTKKPSYLRVEAMLYMMMMVVAVVTARSFQERQVLDRGWSCVQRHAITSSRCWSSTISRTSSYSRPHSCTLVPDPPNNHRHRSRIDICLDCEPSGTTPSDPTASSTTSTLSERTRCANPMSHCHNDTLERSSLPCRT